MYFITFKAENHGTTKSFPDVSGITQNIRVTQDLLHLTLTAKTGVV